MMLLELGAILALLASVSSEFQAMSVEYGLRNVTDDDDTSPALAAALIMILVSVVIFWGLLVVRGVSFDDVTIRKL